MGINMFTTGAVVSPLDTYAKLPFQEIAFMGDQLRKRSNESLAAMAATQDLMNLPVHSADVGFREADQQGFKNRLAGITKLHEEGKFDQAKRESVLLADELKTWKQQGRGYQMAQNYQDYQNNLKMIDSAVAKNVLSADRAAWEKEQLNLGYKGVGDLTDSGYNQYQSNLPTVIDKQFPEQALSAINHWQSDKDYKLITTKDGSYFINEEGDKVEASDVKKGVLQYLDNPLNRAWAEREAEFKMRNLDPNQTSFDINGKSVTRGELKQQLIQEQFDSAAEFAANKAGYTRTSATLTYNQHLATLMKARTAQEKAKNAADIFSAGGTEFVKVTKDNIDDLIKSNADLRKSIKEQDKSLEQYKKANPNVSANENDPNYDKVYHDLVLEQEKSQLQLAETESFLHSSKVKVAKDISQNTGVYQFLDYKDSKKYTTATHEARGTSSYKNTIYGLSDYLLQNPSMTPNKELSSAMAEISNGQSPKLLNKLLQKNIQLGLGFDEFLDKYNIPSPNLKKSSDNPLLWELKNQYNNALSQYSKDLEKSIKNDSEQVDSFRLIANIDSGRHASADTILSKEIAEQIISTAGQGYSVPTGGQLDQYMKDEFGEGWSEEYAKAWKDGKVSIQQTSGMSASGKPILNMSVTDSSGIRHNIPILSNSPDLYLKTAQSMSRSNYPDTRQVGEDMLMNAATIGGNNIGSIVKGVSLESMFTEDNKAKEAVKSPLYGFKENGLQLYVAPQEIAGNGKRLYKIVDKDGKTYVSNIGGSNDLKKVLYESAKELYKNNEDWKNLYGGLGK